MNKTKKLLILTTLLLITACTSKIDKEYLALYGLTSKENCSPESLDKYIEFNRSNPNYVFSNRGVTQKDISVEMIKECYKKMLRNCHKDTNKLEVFIRSYQGKKFSEPYIEKAKEEHSRQTIYNEFRALVGMNDGKPKHKELREFISKYENNKYANERSPDIFVYISNSCSGGIISCAKPYYKSLSRKIGKTKYVSIMDVFRQIETPTGSISEQDDFMAKYVGKEQYYEFSDRDVQTSIPKRSESGKIYIVLHGTKLKAEFIPEEQIKLFKYEPSRFMRAKCKLEIIDRNKSGYGLIMLASHCSNLEISDSNGDFQEDLKGNW